MLKYDCFVLFFSDGSQSRFSKRSSDVANLDAIDCVEKKRLLSVQTRVLFAPSAVEPHEDCEDAEEFSLTPCGNLHCSWLRWCKLPHRHTPHLLRRHSVANLIDRSLEVMFKDGETLADEVARCIWSARCAPTFYGVVDHVPFYTRGHNNDASLDLWHLFVNDYNCLDDSSAPLAMFFCMESGTLEMVSDRNYRSDPQLWDTSQYRLIYSTDDISVAFHLQFESRDVCLATSSDENSDDDSDEKNNQPSAKSEKDVARFKQLCERIKHIDQVFYCGKTVREYIFAQFSQAVARNMALIGYDANYNSFIEVDKDIGEKINSQEQIDEIRAKFPKELILVFDNLQISK